VTWTAPDVERSEGYPERRNESEQAMLRAALEGATLDETFTFQDKPMSVRWMWQHLVEEYARHNGHADLIREAIDGSAGP
jgi:hypothetical protein